MHHRLTTVVLAAATLLLITTVACGSSPGNNNNNNNNGPPTSSTCNVTKPPDEGFPCAMDLSGAETYPNLSCGAGFARLDNGTMTLRQITGHGKTGSGSPLGLLLASISVQFGGVPPTGLILQIPSGQVAEQFALNTAAPGFTEVSIILVDSAGGQKDYYSDNPDGGMSLSLKQATLATLPDGGGILPDAGLSSDFWCLHGHITADVPNLTPGPVTVIHVSADF